MREAKSPVLLILGVSILTLFFPFGVSFLSIMWKIICYVVCALLLSLPNILIRVKRNVFSYQEAPHTPQILFWFLIIHLYYPVSRVLEHILPFSFLGVTYLPVIILILVLLKTVPSWKDAGRWFTWGRIRGFSVLLICIVALFSGFALFLWVRLLKPDLSLFLSMMPRAGAGLLLLAGFGFATSNAFVEEMLFRGFLWQGLEGRKWIQLIISALLFGLLHFRGFPGGAVGIGMVFIWGIFLGILRSRTGGLLAPYLAHVAADMTIFGLLCGLYY